MLREKYKPDLVLLPTKDDIHQDHSTVSMEGLRAFKNTTVMGYELIWNNLKFNSSAFVELSKENLQKKINALKKYKSQKEKTYMKKSLLNL